MASRLWKNGSFAATFAQYFSTVRHNALRRAENPDIVFKHYHPGACNSGDQALTADTAIASRQVFDVPEPKIVVIEHRAMVAGA